MGPEEGGKVVELLLLLPAFYDEIVKDQPVLVQQPETVFKEQSRLEFLRDILIVKQIHRDDIKFLAGTGNIIKCIPADDLQPGEPVDGEVFPCQINDNGVVFDTGDVS